MSSSLFQTPDLDPTQARIILDTVLAALPAIPNVEPEVAQSQQQAATDLLRELQPANGIEALLAAHVVASHYAAMDAWRRACDPALSNERVHTQRGDARSLARLAKDTLLTLQRGRNAKGNRTPRPVVPVAGASGPARPLASPRDTTAETEPGHNPIHQFAPPAAAASPVPKDVPAVPRAPDQAIPPNHAPAHNPIHQFAPPAAAASPAPDAAPSATRAPDQAVPPNHEPAHNPIHQSTPPAAVASPLPEAAPPARRAPAQAVPPKNDSGNRPHTPVRHSRRTRYRHRRTAVLSVEHAHQVRVAERPCDSKHRRSAKTGR